MFKIILLFLFIFIFSGCRVNDDILYPSYGVVIIDNDMDGVYIIGPNANVIKLPKGKCMSYLNSKQFKICSDLINDYRKEHKNNKQ